MSAETGIRRVLIADDDPTLRELLVLKPEAEGFHVRACSDGDDACRQAYDDPPDLVVLDVMMPERDGLSALALLKADRRTRDVPVVLLTARATDSAIWEGWESGADYYITKPFDVDELLHFIKYLQA